MKKKRCWHILSSPWAGMENWCAGNCEKPTPEPREKGGKL